MLVEVFMLLFEVFMLLAEVFMLLADRGKLIADIVIFQPVVSLSEAVVFLVEIPNTLLLLSH